MVMMWPRKVCTSHVSMQTRRRTVETNNHGNRNSSFKVTCYHFFLWTLTARVFYSHFTMTSQQQQHQPSSLSTEASRLFRVYRTIGNLLDKRGYMVPKEMREMTPAGFVAKFGDQPAREGLTILVVRLLLLM